MSFWPDEGTTLSDLDEGDGYYEDEETAKVTFKASSWNNISFREEKEFDTEIPKSEWDEWPEHQKSEFLKEFLDEWTNDIVEISWEE